MHLVLEICDNQVCPFISCLKGMPGARKIWLTHYPVQNITAVFFPLCHTIIVFRHHVGSNTEAKISSPAASTFGGNLQQKKSILVGKRPGLGVTSMLSQFKNYSQTKKNPVLSQRPSVFSSPEDDDEEDDNDYSKFLAIKGNHGLCYCLSGDLLGSDIYCIICWLQWQNCLGVCKANVLIACLKSLLQRIQTPNLLSTRWLLLWLREDLSWRKEPRRTTKTTLYFRKLL